MMVQPVKQTPAQRLAALEQAHAEHKAQLQDLRAHAEETRKQAQETHDMVRELAAMFTTRHPGEDATLAEQLGRMARDYDRSKFAFRFWLTAAALIPSGAIMAIMTWMGMGR